MITILKTTANGLETLDELTNNCWINVIDPTPAEIEQLTALGLPQDFITYSLDVDERSRTEREDDGKILILLRIPHFQGTAVDLPYTTIPLGIILTDTYIITVCRWDNAVLQEVATGRLKGVTTGKRNRFVLRMLLIAAAKFLIYLREINKAVDMLEDQLQLSTQNKEVLELLKYQKSLVYFTTALKSNELMMERLKRSQLFSQYPDDEDILEDVLTENQQAIEMVNISNNILSSMMDAFASIISNNLNVVMRFLASMTIVLSIPTIVTSFFGMNVRLPFENWPFASLLIVALFCGISAVTIAVFNRRNWF